jgi:hypothetical protein
MQRVSEWVIVVKRPMGILFSGISWREHATFIDMMMPTLYSANTLGWILIVLTHWHYSPQTDMSLNFDALFWVRADQYLLFLLNAACLAEKQQIPISKGSTDCLEFMYDDDRPLDQVFWNAANHNEMKKKQLCYFFILYVLL